MQPRRLDREGGRSHVGAEMLRQNRRDFEDIGWRMSPEKPALKVLLCSPRGFCAGVVRAIESVERALEVYGPPVYVRHEIVHNRYVVESLRAKGAIFVEELDEVPRHRRAGDFFRPWRAAHRCPRRRRGAICSRSTPPVRWSPRCIARPKCTTGAAAQIVLIGHAGHPEVIGTMGQLPAGGRAADRNSGRRRNVSRRAMPIGWPM